MTKAKHHPSKVRQHVSKENQVNFCTMCHKVFNETLFQKFYSVEGFFLEKKKEKKTKHQPWETKQRATSTFVSSLESLKSTDI